MIVVLIICVLAFLLIEIYFLLDAIITRKRLKENQIAWDEYSKDMSYMEKMEIFPEWLESRKLEKGWSFYYIPRM